MSSHAKILVIFDLDFTLIDNSLTICKAFEYTLAKFQITPPARGLIIQMIGIPLKEMFSDYLHARNIEMAIHHFREYYSAHYYEDVKLIPGAIDLLKKLKAFGYRMALLTSKKTELAKKLLEYYHLKQYFEIIIGEQKELKPKPAPDSLKYILSKFAGIKKAFMIGDHLVDCLAAKKAGVQFIGVLTGNTSFQELQKCAGESPILLDSIAQLDPKQHLI
ncbi:MAG: HAD family hydrolase [Candidatus Helarchaeota archaeon]